MNNQIEKLLREKGADIVRFVDISALPASQTQGYTKAIVFCVALSKPFIRAMNSGEKTYPDEFADKERETDALADLLAEYIRHEGHEAYSQSEENLLRSGHYDEKNHITKLPHKTIARLAGIGFIGKNDLLINEEYGCAFSMCTVLTYAPVEAGRYPIVPQGCGGCDICETSCEENAIAGNEWSETIGRDRLVDVFKCTCSLKCMVDCPYTLRYATT